VSCNFRSISPVERGSARRCEGGRMIATMWRRARCKLWNHQFGLRSVVFLFYRAETVRV